MRSQEPARKDGPRINEEIRVREVHLIDRDGGNKGTVPIADATHRFSTLQAFVC